MNFNQFPNDPMWRRRFLQHTGAVAAAIALPGAMAMPAASRLVSVPGLAGPINTHGNPRTSTQIHILGLGPFGVEFIIDIAPERLPGFVFAGGHCGGRGDVNIREFDEMRASLSGDAVVFVVTAFDESVSGPRATRVARDVRDSGALTIGLVPGFWSGRKRQGEQVDRAIMQLEAAVDALIFVPAAPDATYGGGTLSAYWQAGMNPQLQSIVQSVAGSLNPPFTSSIDREDLRAAFQTPGRFAVVAERASGPHRADVAVQNLRQRLMHGIPSAERASSAVALIGFGTAFPKLGDSKHVMNAIRYQLQSTADICFSMYSDFALGEDMRVTLIYPSVA